MDWFVYESDLPRERVKDPCTSENEHPKKNGQFELADETEKSWGDDSKPKG